MRAARPIIFSAPMVRAILSGTKTQTRRIVKPSPILGEPLDWCAAAKAQKPGWLRIVGDYRRFCPYGNVGSMLWVKETFVANYFDDWKPAFRADWDGSAADVCHEPKWTPSIYMPRALSRITLEVTGARVERLHDITDDDARSGGIRHVPTGARGGSGPTSREQFAALWDRINGKRAPWEKNPWVWVVGFRVASATMVSE